MEIELITTKRKLSRAVINQMQLLKNHEIVGSDMICWVTLDYKSGNATYQKCYIVRLYDGSYRKAYKLPNDKEILNFIAKNESLVEQVFI